MEKDDLMEKLGSDVNELDLSRDEDLSIGLMNLISLEEHLFFTHEKTGSDDPLEILSEIRKIRTEAMKELVENTDGEEWCISKHLLAASMRFRETGDKMLDRDREKAEQFYDQAFSLYSMFWAINLNAPDKGELKQETENIKEKDVESRENVDLSNADSGNSPMLSQAKDLVKKAMDCCKEI